MRFEVLVEGESDVPAVREIFVRGFGLQESVDFNLHPHRGRGRLPANPLKPPPVNRQGLLDQLPAKLKGYSHLGGQGCVVVLVDADDEPCDELLRALNRMLERLPKRPLHVLFRIAIEETESWFIADPAAVQAAYPKAKVARLRRIQPDAVVGASEELAAALSVPVKSMTGATKAAWASHIAPHLNLEQPRSPSLQKFIEGIGRYRSSSSPAGTKVPR
jgi:hypothetical protein